MTLALASPGCGGARRPGRRQPWPLSVTPAPRPSAVCLKGAKVHLKCFLAVAQARAFHAAGEDCIARGGTLAAPRSEEENEALREYAARSLGAAAELWLGLHDLGSEGSWVDASGAPATFVHWETEITAQPDGGTAENCAAMAGAEHGRWFDRRCRDELPYVCQFAIV